MPSFLVPRHVSAHRIAAIALYRSLLRQCRAAPLQLSQNDAIQNIVRNRFKQTQHLHSHARLKIAFTAGYEAIDYLDASCAGNEESTKYLVSLLGRAKPKVRAAPPLTATALKIRSAVSKAALSEERARQGAAPKPSDAIFARPQPLETLSGKRHVPRLFNAGSIPVLRIRKPQPESLSGFINNRLKQRQKRWDRRQWLEQQITFGKYEDDWDDLLNDQGVLSSDADQSWALEFGKAKGVVVRALAQEGRKNVAMAEKMQAVVDREQALLDEENNVKKAKKKAERLLRTNAWRNEQDSQQNPINESHGRDTGVS